MTRDEIKDTIRMPDLMARYGIEIRHRMCSCPFHGADKHPSMKVFKDGANCFTCGWNGDIFKFVMDMDGVDFKTAFLSLGGEYEHHKTENARIYAEKKIQAQKEKRKRQDKADKELFKDLTKAIDVCRKVKATWKPFTDGWCYAVNVLPSLLFNYEEKYIHEREIDELNVYRTCRQVKCRFFLGDGVISRVNAGRG